MHNSLVKVTTQDDLILHGYFRKAQSQTVVLHIHGFESDFFSPAFLENIGDVLSKKDISFLSVQTRGTAYEQEIYTSAGGVKVYGSHLELLEEAYLDIDAWVKFLLDQGYTTIILEGHSLGTFKIMRYLFEGKYASNIAKLILIAPFDKNGQEDVVTNGKWKEYVEISRQKVEEGNGSEYIPEYFEEVRMSYQTFYSWYKESDLNKMFDVYNKEYNFPILHKVTIPVCLLVGSKDEYFHRTNPSNPQEAFDTIVGNLNLGSGSLLEDAKHSFKGYEDILANNVVEFVI